MNIGEVSALTHVSIRTLRHYDKIGLLKPSRVTESGYRQYDGDSLRRLHTILLFRELEFPLADIRRILDSPDFDPAAALDDQIKLLAMRREHIDQLLKQAEQLKQKGLTHMDFSAFDTRKMDDYAAQAKAAWGHTEAWAESQAREKKNPGSAAQAGQQLMELIGSFGASRHLDPASAEAQQIAQQLRDFISGHFYNCTLPIFSGLADMYDAGGDFTRNIDKAGGPGTAAFLASAMRHYCQINKN